MHVSTASLANCLLWEKFKIRGGKGRQKDRNTPSFLLSPSSSHSTFLIFFLSVQTVPVQSKVT